MSDRSSFISGINDSIYNTGSGSILEGLFREYERVIVRSIITSFGLDAFIQDIYGGDVDTILNVRKIGNDDKMVYKSQENLESYKRESQRPYSHDDVTKPGSTYQKRFSEARDKYHDDIHNTVTDTFENKELGFLGKSKERPTNLNANLDHVITTLT